MTGTSVALHVTVSASVLAGLPVTWRSRRGDGPGRRSIGPGGWLAVVAGLLVVNQILFTVYALRVRHGDMSYLGGYVPDGWFVLARGPVTTWLAEHWPAPELLAVCALRLPSLLELPLGMLGYLTVVNWLDPALFRRLTGTPVLALTSASYTVTFGLIELAMGTACTNQDLVLRAVSAVLTVLALRRLSPRPAPAPRTAGELLVFAASAAALGYLILALYDSVLLYSLGKAGPHVPGAVAAGALLAAARITAARLRRRPVPAPAGPGIDTLCTGLSWWLALFLVPALAIRYELGFGSRAFAAAAGLLVIAAATAATFVEVYGRLPGVGRAAAVRRWLSGLAVAGVAAVLAAAAGLAVPASHQELRLLWAATLFVLTATGISAAWDRATRPDPVTK
ncbi:hypothetical protein [Actinoplanes siamensis]|uniref:Uncharacterized protein n=1 Tax=Actinoplanes siamensis TaxID=1223317 RepID=A0A919NCJ0_9ACTN|nr:hypothetical protein [Actinoplanes siamensis]GIF08327.1 hypothetical protein Asi03nite_58650 [Actinoplanes siamensis]